MLGRRRAALCLSSAVIALTVASVSSQVRPWRTVAAGGGSSPLSENCHPRTFGLGCGSSDSMPAIRTKLGSDTDKWQSDYQAWINSVVDPLIAASPSGNVATRVSDAFVLAVVGAIGTVSGVTFPSGHVPADYCNRAHDYIADIWASGNIDPYMPATVLPGAIDLAWSCADAAEKQTAFDLLQICGSGGARDFCHATGAWAPVNSQSATTASLRLVSAIVMKGSGLTGADAWADTRLAEWSSWWRAFGSPRFESILGGADGEFGQGPSYAYYSLPTEVIAEESYRGANGISLATHYASDDTRYLRAAPYTLLRAIAPYALANSGLPDGSDWRVLRFGDSGAFYTVNSTRSEMAITMGMLADRLKTVDASSARLAAWELEHRIPSAWSETTATRMDPTDASTRVVWGICFLVCDRTVPQESPADQSRPLATCTDGGRCFFRYAWGSGPVIRFTAAIRATKSGAGVDWEQGALNIHWPTAPILESRANGLQSLYNSPGDQNILMFPDRGVSSSFAPVPETGGTQYAGDNYGGMRLLGGPSLVSHWDVGAQYRRMASAPVVVLENTAAGRDVNWVNADITAGYDTSAHHEDSNPIRVSAVRRQFFARRGASATAEHIAVIHSVWTVADTRYVPTDILNFPGVDVTFGGTSNAGTPAGTRNGSTDCHTYYTGSGKGTATWSVNRNGFTGAAKVTFANASSLDIVKAGGDSPTGGWVNNATQASYPAANALHSCEFVGLYGERRTVDNVTHNSSIEDLFMGWWQAQVSPATVPTTGYMAYLVQAGDLGFSPSTVTEYQGTNYQTLCAGASCFVFGQTAEGLTSGTFQVPAGTIRVLIANTTGSRTLSCAPACTSVTQIDPADSANPYAFSSAQEAYFEIVTTATTVITVS